MGRKSKNLLMIFLMAGLLIILTGCGSTNTSPIEGFSGITDILVWPIAGMMWLIGNVIPSYGVVIIIATLLIRTAAWPIYAKTNDMSLKMQIMGPELQKIEAKYEGKEDQDSKQRKQAETMALYKKYGVGLGGCLTPILQFPLFIAFYETLRRVPATIGEQFTLNFGIMNHKFLGIDLFEGVELSEAALAAGTDPNFQKYGIWALAIIVAVSQIISQIIMMARQKKQQAEMYVDVPDYRQPKKTEQQKSQGLMMNIFAFSMSIMMALFVLRSPAALGLYWLIGNLYTMLQSYINSRGSTKRKDKLKTKFNGGSDK